VNSISDAAPGAVPAGAGAATTGPWGGAEGFAAAVPVRSTLIGNALSAEAGALAEGKCEPSPAGSFLPVFRGCRAFRDRRKIAAASAVAAAMTTMTNST